MQTLLPADTETALGVQEVNWQILPVKDKGGGSRIGQTVSDCIADLTLSQPNLMGSSKVNTALYRCPANSRSG